MKTKKWYKSRTILLALLQSVAGLVAVFATEYPEFGLLLQVKSVLDVALRLSTELKLK